MEPHNLETFEHYLTAVDPDVRFVFEAKFIGYLSSRVSSHEWIVALELARQSMGQAFSNGKFNALAAEREGLCGD